MSSKKHRELGGWNIKTAALNLYKENVKDDPLLKRHYTSGDIHKRIRSALNHTPPSDAISVGNRTILYRNRFTAKGSFYYIVTKSGENPIPVVGIWTEEIYQKYLNGITSKGSSIFEQTR